MNFKRALEFIRVTDERGNLSLTNLALVAAIVNLFIRTDVDLNSVLTLLGTLISYQGKRWLSTPGAEPTEVQALQEALGKLETSVKALQIGSVTKR